MKMMRHRDSSAAKRQQVVWRNTMIVATILCATALLCRPVRVALSGALYSFAPSVWGVRTTTVEVKDGFFANLQIKRSLEYDNSVLREDVSRMQAKVLDRNLLAERVLRLEDALGREGVDNRVYADVLVGPRQSAYDILVIDAGEEHGVAVGDPVVYSGSGVIGEITEVHAASSKVKLYSSPVGELHVLVGADAVPGVAHGRGMGNFDVKLPKGTPVVVGEPVVLAGGKLILGIVGQIEEEPALPFVNVLFRTSFNITEIRSVEVITNNH